MIIMIFKRNKKKNRRKKKKPRHSTTTLTPLYANSNNIIHQQDDLNVMFPATDNFFSSKKSRTRHLKGTSASHLVGKRQVKYNGPKREATMIFEVASASLQPSFYGFLLDLYPFSDIQKQPFAFPHVNKRGQSCIMRMKTHQAETKPCALIFTFFFSLLQ
jgi:hypothetical protein